MTCEPLPSQAETMPTSPSSSPAASVAPALSKQGLWDRLVPAMSVPCLPLTPLRHLLRSLCLLVSSALPKPTPRGKLGNKHEWLVWALISSQNKKKIFSWKVFMSQLA